MGVEATVFLLTLAVTYFTAFKARSRAASGSVEEDLAGRSLNRWLIGLSAATTGNSGFIVTGAVGLGYAGGIHWLMLPLSWLAGDLVFWSLFPARLNRTARAANVTTLSELLTFNLSGRSARLISIIVALLLVTFLSVYTSAQWLAGKKFLSAAFQMSDTMALCLFGITIILYSSLGGFRGSVYTDTVQAVIRIVGTLLALAAVAWQAFVDQGPFLANIAAAGPGFLAPFSDGIVSALGFIGGYACSAIGFGLGQPQLVTRYLAGASPEETKAARWIYIGFTQGTWIAMTLFGILLRGVMPGIADPETGLSRFFQQNFGALVTGIIFADVFATIASTSNGILVAIAQTLRRDLLGRLLGDRQFSVTTMTLVTLLTGFATIGLSFVLPGNVSTIIIGAVSKIGAGLAGPVMIRVFGWKHTAFSVLMAIVVGLAASFAWTNAGYSALFNEAGIGIVASLIANAVVARLNRARVAAG